MRMQWFAIQSNGHECPVLSCNIYHTSSITNDQAVGGVKGFKGNVSNWRECAIRGHDQSLTSGARGAGGNPCFGQGGIPSAKILKPVHQPSSRWSMANQYWRQQIPPDQTHALHCSLVLSSLSWPADVKSPKQLACNFYLLQALVLSLVGALSISHLACSFQIYSEQNIKKKARCLVGFNSHPSILNSRLCRRWYTL